MIIIDHQYNITILSIIGLKITKNLIQKNAIKIVYPKIAIQFKQTIVNKASLLDDIEAETGPVINTLKRSIVENFVKKIGGKRVLQRILIANNGMAATKSILSMRQWAYMVLGEFDYDHIILNVFHLITKTINVFTLTLLSSLLHKLKFL